METNKEGGARAKYCRKLLSRYTRRVRVPNTISVKDAKELKRNKYECFKPQKKK